MADSPKLRLVDIPRELAADRLSPAERAADESARAAITGYLDAYGALRDGLVVA
jgi:hypothetical protein